MTTALLVIDVQQALCSGRYEAFEARRVIDRINQVSRMARAAHAPVVIIQHESDEGPFAHGTEGWQLAEGLEALPADTLVRKRATDSFHNTELLDVLQIRGVTRLVICGLQSEFCVDTTTRRALALGFAVTLVSDAHSTMDNGVLSAAQITAHHNVTLANITSFGPRVVAVPASDVRFETPPLHFSPYQPGDRAACLRLFDANSPAFFAPNERADYVTFLDATEGGYELCRRAGQVLGAFGVQPAGAEAAYLRWILLAPEAQGQGIGTAMMRRVAGLALGQNRPLVRIAASHKSAPFFARFGARITTTTRDGWGPGMDRIDMEWRPTLA